VRRIEGYVIVSTDGMLADAEGEMPDSIRNEADQRYFQAALDRAAVVVHGRHSYEGGPRAARRKRLIVTRQVAAIAPDPEYPNALLWNPLGASLEQALERLGVGDGTVAIIGGPEVFSLFLPLYDAFHLSRAPRVTLPGGHPVFRGVPANTPEQVLAARGLEPRARQVLDPGESVTLVTWRRSSVPEGDA